MQTPELWYIRCVQGGGLRAAFHCHGIAQTGLVLLIWLTEKIEFLYNFIKKELICINQLLGTG